MRRTFATILGGLWLAGVTLAPAFADDPEAGRKIANMCRTCHGADGISQLLDAPNLAGETNIYIDTQLKAFKRGKRKHEIMSEVAADLSDQEIRQIADWYAAVDLEITPPPGQ